METLDEVVIAPRILWPMRTPMAALVDLESHTPDIPLKMPLFELSLSLRGVQVVFVPPNAMELYLSNPHEAIVLANEILQGVIVKIQSDGVYIRYFVDPSKKTLNEGGNQFCAFDNVFFYRHSELYQIERLGL